MADGIDDAVVADHFEQIEDGFSPCPEERGDESDRWDKEGDC